ncbi:MAG: O-antigen ligase family protein, partial [Verrucomicrobiaceae bacterium]|nr:O-antigen ligase family protein [Verrucomicrobiaceae bacterium]
GTGQGVVGLVVLVGAADVAGRALLVGPLGWAVPDVVQVLLFILVYFLVLYSPHQFKWVMIAGMGVICVAHLGVAAFQMPEENNFFVWKENPENLKFLTGIFGHYNPFSAFLNGSLFFFLSYFFLGKKWVIKLLCGLLIVGILSGVVLSGSRGGWVSLVIGAVVWVFLLMGYLWKRQSKLLGPVVLVGFLFVIAGAFSSVWMVKKISSERRDLEIEQMSEVPLDDGGRLAMQQMAFEIFLDSPLLGQGPRSFSYLSLENWDPDMLWIRIGMPDFAHNEYLQVLSDYGAVGFLIIIVLLIAHGALGTFQIIGDHDGRREEADLPIWQLGAAAGLAAILAQCYFSFLFHVPACVVLVALQLGILGNVGGPGRAPFGVKALGRIVVVSIAVISGIMGWRFSNAFLDTQGAMEESGNVVGESDAFSLVSKLEEAGRLSWDPKASESAGQALMSFAMVSDQKRDVEQARRFRERAKVSFGKALQLNPHSPVALSGMPQLDDALGNFESADRGHRLAMKKLWPLEFHLRSQFFAARGAYARGYDAYRKGLKGQAENFYRLAKERLEMRGKVFGQERKDSYNMRVALESWLAFLEGERLYREGDRVWKEARPRDPERAHALMLAAESRYKKSRKVVEPIDSQWETDWAKVKQSLDIFKLGRVKPAKLSPEEVEAIAIPEAVLASPAENR